jgi:hypothetical protein
MGAGDGDDDGWLGPGVGRKTGGCRRLLLAPVGPLARGVSARKRSGNDVSVRTSIVIGFGS